MPREALGIERRRSDDHLEIGPLRQELLQVAEQEIDVEAALVRLVDDDRVVGAEQRVALRLGEQDAVRHQLDERVGLRVVGEADLVADDVSRRGAKLVRDSRRHCARGDSSRLRVADEPALAATDRHADLRQLRGLARARFAADDDDLMVADGLRDVRRALRDGELGRIRRSSAVARRAHAGARPSARIACSIRSHSAAGARARARALDAAQKRNRIPGHAESELREETVGLAFAHAAGRAAARILPRATFGRAYDRHHRRG